MAIVLVVVNLLFNLRYNPVLIANSCKSLLIYDHVEVK
jgi:hypothetical protein